ncbi:MAG: pyridoxamine 5'-phosphate oxidase family protein [Clostridiales Family XIII bacterium]|jgi:nitroimidazol reductase NimA-like FMN-containing flavoprotein (pyridoxamine 5'-phosphate oxidase superfamily)|nr:pyridoxamine 5'-phosphate oxidase family protein [Clostridiales Family XIII bacterium]
MRKSDREVKSIEKIKAVIDGCDACRVGLPTEGAPYVVPLNFGYELCGGDGAGEAKLTLWFHCATEGRKLDLIDAFGSGGECAAGFEMDTDHELVVGKSSCDFSMKYKSVIGTGVIRRAADAEEKLHGLKAIMAHYGGDGLPFNEAILARTCVLRLDASEFACKRLDS